MSIEFQKDPIEVWLRKKAKLLVRFKGLNEGDFYFNYTNNEVMITKLHTKLGISRDELTNLLSGL
jgi:hypothetical protein